MKNFILCLNSLIYLIFSLSAEAEIFTVGPDDNLQNIINKASSGDEIKLLQGVYTEEITISSKSINIEPLANAAVVITKLTVTNSNAFVGLKRLTIQGDVNATSSDLNIYNCSIGGSVYVTKGSIDITNSTVGSNIWLYDNNRSNVLTSAKIIKCSVSNYLLCKAGKASVMYNTIRFARFEGGQARVIGNHFSGRAVKGVGITIWGGKTNVKIFNNKVEGYTYGERYNSSGYGIGIMVGHGASAEILNNVIFNCFDNNLNGAESRVGMGIHVREDHDAANAIIMGNAIWNCFVAGGIGTAVGSSQVWAPATGVIFKNNFLWKTKSEAKSWGGGVQSVDNIWETNASAVVFKDKTGGDFTPATNSPLINAGSPDPQYNDRDGSRNDIGMFGGHNFIPDGRTTNKPIVLGLDIAPIAVPTGGTVTIQSTGATVK